MSRPIRTPFEWKVHFLLEHGVEIRPLLKVADTMEIALLWFQSHKLPATSADAIAFTKLVMKEAKKAELVCEDPKK